LFAAASHHKLVLVLDIDRPQQCVTRAAHSDSLLELGELNRHRVRATRRAIDSTARAAMVAPLDQRELFFAARAHFLLAVFDPNGRMHA